MYLNEEKIVFIIWTYILSYKNENATADDVNSNSPYDVQKYFLVAKKVS